MKDFIRDIWNGKIVPGEDWMRATPEMRYLERAKDECRVKLVSRLNDEEKTVLDNYDENEAKIDNLYFENAFIAGIRFAVTLFVEALG